MQEEEKGRNSVMLDLLYVHPAHPLASQIIQYYRICFQLDLHEKFVWPIDQSARLVNLIISWLSSFKNYDHFAMIQSHCLNYMYPLLTFCSGGMNGYLWLCERNNIKNVVPSPVNGLQDLDNNRVM